MFLKLSKARCYNSLVVSKPVYGVSDHVGYKPVCVTAEASKRHGILDIESRAIDCLDSQKLWVLTILHNNAADLHLCFCVCQKQDFSLHFTYFDINVHHVVFNMLCVY